MIGPHEMALMAGLIVAHFAAAGLLFLRFSTQAEQLTVWSVFVLHLSVAVALYARCQESVKAVVHPLAFFLTVFVVVIALMYLEAFAVFSLYRRLKRNRSTRQS